MVRQHLYYDYSTFWKLTNFQLQTKERTAVKFRLIARVNDTRPISSRHRRWSCIFDLRGKGFNSLARANRLTTRPSRNLFEILKMKFTAEAIHIYIYIYLYTYPFFSYNQSLSIHFSNMQSRLPSYNVRNLEIVSIPIFNIEDLIELLFISLGI